MSFSLSQLVNRLSNKNELLESRQELFGSLHPISKDRRRAERVSIERGSLHLLTEAKGRILDLGDRGLALETEGSCCFARGERHRLTLTQGRTSIDVDGTVCWTQSTWSRSGAADAASYRQTAGFHVQAPPHSDAEQDWQFLTSIIKDIPRGLALTRSEVIQSCSRKD